MVVYAKDLIEKALLHMNRAENAIPTGYGVIDEKLNGGFQKGYLYILGGRPGIGKTTLALNVIGNIMEKHQKKVLYYCYQTDAENIVKKMIRILSHGNEKYYQEAVDDLRKYDFIIDTDANLGVFGKCFDEDISYDDVGFIVVDDLQHISGFYEGGVCKGLKEIAKEKDVPILVISNLTRAVEDKYETNRPIIPDLSQSLYGDSAAHYADVVMFLYEDEYYNPETEKKNIAEVIIAKNTTGPLGTCELVDIKPLMIFANLVRE